MKGPGLFRLFNFGQGRGRVDTMYSVYRTWKSLKISFGTAGGLVSLRKRWKGKSPRGTEEPQKEEHCEMKGTKAKGVEEKNDEHEKEERKDEGKGADKKWKGGRTRRRSGRKRFYRHCINFVQLESDMNHDMKEFFLARLECHISLGNGPANKNRTGDCGSATFCIHDLVSKPQNI